MSGGRRRLYILPKSDYYTGLGQGSHTFEVRGADRVGNLSAPAVRTWFVDTVAPTITFMQQRQRFQRIQIQLTPTTFLILVRALQWCNARSMAQL